MIGIMVPLKCHDHLFEMTAKCGLHQAIKKGRIRSSATANKELLAGADPGESTGGTCPLPHLSSIITSKRLKNSDRAVPYPDKTVTYPYRISC